MSCNCHYIINQMAFNVVCRWRNCKILTQFLKPSLVLLFGWQSMASFTATSMNSTLWYAMSFHFNTSDEAIWSNIFVIYNPPFSHEVCLLYSFFLRSQQLLDSRWIFYYFQRELSFIYFLFAFCRQIDENENVTMIDFPQMVSVSHRNAQMYEVLLVDASLMLHLPHRIRCLIRLYFIISYTCLLGTLTEMLNASSSFSPRGQLLVSLRAFL